MKTIAAVAAAAVVAGCASIESPLDDGYQFGDLTKAALVLQAEYCANTDYRLRAFRLAALRAAGVPVPPSGACGDIVERALAEGWVPSVEVDLEEAKADQERFQGLDDPDAD